MHTQIKISNAQFQVQRMQNQTMEKGNKLILMKLRFDTKRKERLKKIMKTLNTHLLPYFVLLELHFPQLPIVVSINSLVTDGLKMVTVMELMVK